METNFTPWRRAIAALATLGCLAPSLAFSAMVVQDRDEPGRVPYQEEQFGCSSSSCTLTYKKVPAATRRVVTHVACDQFVPNGGSPYYVTLSSNVFAEPFIPLLFQYSAPYNSGAGAVYIANTEVLAYFGAGRNPSVTLNGGSTALANAHCNLSGYDVSLP